MPLWCRPIIGLFHQENEDSIIKKIRSSLKVSCVSHHNLFLKRWGVFSGEGGSHRTTQGSIWGATQKFGECKQCAWTNCHVPFCRYMWLAVCLWISVPTVVKLRGHVIKFSAFLWGYVLVIQRFFLQLIWWTLRSKESASNFVWNLKNTAGETHRMLQEAFGDNAMSQSKTFLWYKRFKDGQMSVDDDERSGWLSTSTTLKT